MGQATNKQKKANRPLHKHPQLQPSNPSSAPRPEERPAAAWPRLAWLGLGWLFCCFLGGWFFLVGLVFFFVFLVVVFWVKLLQPLLFFGLVVFWTDVVRLF